MFSNIFLGPLVDEDDTAGKDQRVHRKGGGGGDRTIQIRNIQWLPKFFTA